MHACVESAPARMAMNGVEGSPSRPPPGFTPDQWREFGDRGLPVVENAFDTRGGGQWQEAILRVQRSAATNPDGFFPLRNFVEADPAFACLIDHPAYVGFVYDLYGEMLKLQLSELFVRAPGSGARPERWHIDGPRVLP